MSFSQLLVGTSIVGATLNLVVLSVLPDPAPITVHSLAYTQGNILQERTVKTEGEYFPAKWSAAIYSVDTGEPVSLCTGNGFWNYSSGYRTAEIPLNEWVNRDECTIEVLRKVGGSFQPVASWHWGDDFTIHKGVVFTP